MENEKRRPGKGGEEEKPKELFQLYANVVNVYFPCQFPCKGYSVPEI